MTASCKGKYFVILPDIVWNEICLATSVVNPSEQGYNLKYKCMFLMKIIKIYCYLMKHIKRCVVYYINIMPIIYISISSGTELISKWRRIF
jgi:hypothetical protein